MTFCRFSSLSLLGTLISLARVTQASYKEDVEYAYMILGQLDAWLARPFCYDYVGPYASPTAHTVRKHIVVTTTLAPSTCSSAPGPITPGFIKLGPITPGSITPSIKPGSITPSSKPDFINPSFIKPGSIKPSSIKPNFIKPGSIKTSSIKPSFITPSFITPSFITPSFITPSFITPGSSTSCSTETVCSASHPIPWLSTVYSTTTATYWVTSTIYIEPTPPEAQKREPKILPERDIWCSNYGMPCRLAQYRPKVVFEACQRYLGRPRVVTITTTMRHRVTATARRCM